MTITGAIVLFAVAWFMCLFVILPLNITSQDEAGDVVPGTPASAPERPQLARKFRLTTYWAAGIWVAMVAVISSGLISIQDLDVFSNITD